MATTIAEYYIDELEEWDRLIVFYGQEIDEFEDKLADVVHRNTIPGIAAKVEAHQDKLSAVSKTFYNLQSQMLRQESRLRSDSTFIENALINTDTEKQQDELRGNMQQAEKEYINVKYDCYNFLSGTLKK